jgi:hypothetical protein
MTCLGVASQKRARRLRRAGENTIFFREHVIALYRSKHVIPFSLNDENSANTFPTILPFVSNQQPLYLFLIGSIPAWTQPEREELLTAKCNS